jgi:hypothetical protein
VVCQLGKFLLATSTVIFGSRSLGHTFLSHCSESHTTTPYCYLKGHLFKLGLTDDPTCERCLEEDSISPTYLVWMWYHSLFKISSPGPVPYGTKWLLRHPHKQSPTFHSKCRINKGLIKQGSTINHWRLRCKGQIFMAHPLYI